MRALYRCHVTLLVFYRKVLERATVQTLPARKMKTLFKKFISFEERYGTPAAVEQIQQRVADYVEKQCNK